jgi:alpha-N-arabinofuranosidase
MASSVELADRIETAEGIIRAVLSGEPGNRKIYIAWDEWNVWYRARGSRERGRRILEERYNLEDALVVATFLNTFINHSHVVKIANMAQMVNVIAPIFTNEKGLFLQTIYYPLQLFANNSKGKALQLFVEGPKYTSRRLGDVAYLDTSAAYNNGTLVVNVVNKHQDQAIETEFEVEDKQFSGAVEVAEVNGPDIKAENDFGSTKVSAVQRSVSASGRKFTYRFPAHSYTMLKVKLS